MNIHRPSGRVGGPPRSGLATTADGAARARSSLFSIGDLAHLDDEALRTFLAPCPGGVGLRDLARALIGCDDRLVDRVRNSIPPEHSAEFSSLLATSGDPRATARARERLLAELFWPLVYWLRPDDYEELVRGEQISPRLLAELDIDGKIVCDIGAGSGRFALLAAPRARHVIAVDGAPPLLERLARAASRIGYTNIETRRGAFTALPLADGSVDLAVACSAFTTWGPHGGDAAIDEAERIVRPGGHVAIIWPQDHQRHCARGYQYIRVRGEGTVRFRDVATALHLCATYYSASAADWVRVQNSADVPYRVLGVRPPNDMCIRRIPE